MLKLYIEHGESWLSLQMTDYPAYEEEAFYEDDFTDEEDDRGSSKGHVISGSKSVATTKPARRVKAFTSQASVNTTKSGETASFRSTFV